MRITLASIAMAGLLMGSADPVTSQERNDAVKNPAVALGFAWLCPGCGHLYSGETTKGALIAAISIGSLATGAAIQLTRGHEIDCSTREPLNCQPSMDLTPILIGSAIGLAGYVYGLIDAGASARRMNERNGIEFRGFEVNPAVAVDGSLGAQLSVRVPNW